MSMCVCVSVCISSRTPKPWNLAAWNFACILIELQGSARGEKWVFGLIKTPLLKTINRPYLIISYIRCILGHCSLQGLKTHPRKPHWHLKPPCILACSTMPWLWIGRNGFLTIKCLLIFFFQFLHSYHRMPNHHTYESLDTSQCL